MEVYHLISTAVAIVLTLLFSNSLILRRSYRKHWRGEGVQKRAFLLVLCDFFPCCPYPLRRPESCGWRSATKTGGNVYFWSFLTLNGNKTFGWRALHSQNCVDWWMDLWLQMKSPSEHPFRVLCLSQLFCVVSVAVQSTSIWHSQKLSKNSHTFFARACQKGQSKRWSGCQMKRKPQKSPGDLRQRISSLKSWDWLMGHTSPSSLHQMASKTLSTEKDGLPMSSRL